MTKIFFLLIFFFTFSLGLRIEDIRKDYKEAIDSEVKTVEFKDLMQHVKKTDDNRLVAYKGAASALYSQYLKGINKKVKTFRGGTALIEYAVEKAPDDIEIRFVRLSVQQNCPKVLHYRNKIKEDKQFILKNFNAISSESLKSYIRSYIYDTDHFTTEERSSIQ